MRTLRLYLALSIFIIQQIVVSLAVTQQTFANDYLELSLSQVLYSDPKGFFNIRPPEGWLINEYSSDPRGKVDFNSSSASPKAQLKVIGAISPFTDYNGLLSDCRNGAERLRARFGGTSSVKEINKFNVKAVEVRLDIPGKFKQMQIQVLIGNNYYSFAFGGPPDQFNKYEKVVLKSIETFDPVFKLASGSDAASHIIASKIRTAELYLSIGQKDWARVVVDEGLKVDKINKTLLELRDKCMK